jgi:hypothetical protein
MPLPDVEDPTDEPVTEAPAHLVVPADPSISTDGPITETQSQMDPLVSTAGENLQTDPPANDVPVPTISYGDRGKAYVRFIVPCSFI